MSLATVCTGRVFGVVVLVVVVFCLGNFVFPDLLTGLLPPVDFKLVSVYGTVPAYAEVRDGK